MNTDVRGNVITLNSGCSARVPLASQVQVVGALSTNMSLTDVFLFDRVSPISMPRLRGVGRLT